MRVLFVCGQNQWRSPTAEQLFMAQPGLECQSAGLNHDAEQPLTAELVRWAQLILVMERTHLRKLKSRFAEALRGGARVACLDIPDRYPFMDPALVELLQRKVPPHLRGAAG